MNYIYRFVIRLSTFVEALEISREYRRKMPTPHQRGSKRPVQRAFVQVGVARTPTSHPPETHLTSTSDPPLISRFLFHLRGFWWGVTGGVREVFDKHLPVVKRPVHRHSEGVTGGVEVFLRFSSLFVINRNIHAALRDPRNGTS